MPHRFFTRRRKLKLILKQIHPPPFVLHTRPGCKSLRPIPSPLVTPPCLLLHASPSSAPVSPASPPPAPSVPQASTPFCSRNHAAWADAAPPNAGRTAASTTVPNTSRCVIPPSANLSPNPAALTCAPSPPPSPHRPAPPSPATTASTTPKATAASPATSHKASPSPRYPRHLPHPLRQHLASQRRNLRPHPLHRPTPSDLRPARSPITY